MTRDNILELRNAGFATDNNNEPVPENITVATTVDAVANTDIYRNSRIWDLMVLISGEHSSFIPRMFILEFSLLFYPCDYIKLILIPQMNKHLAHKDMDFSEFLNCFGCWLYMDLFEGVVEKCMCWSNMEVNMFEEAPVSLTKYISLNRFEDIHRKISYTDNNVPAYNGKLFRMCQTYMGITRSPLLHHQG